MKQFVIEYRYGGKVYHAEIEAEDFDDADMRKQAIFHGEALQKVPMPWDLWTGVEWFFSGAAAGVLISFLI